MGKVPGSRYGDYSPAIILYQAIPELRSQTATPVDNIAGYDGSIFFKTLSHFIGVIDDSLKK